MGSLSDVAAICDRLIEEGDLAGWIAGVSGPDGHDIRVGGDRRLGGPPMTSDTQVALSSNTKPLAGALALRLVDIGALRLEEPISTWLPEFAQPRVLVSPGAALSDTVPADREITVRQLLTMTPGFGWVGEPGPLAEELSARGLEMGPWGPQMAPDDFIARLSELPLANHPDTAWRYHTSSDVLSVLLARCTGSPVSALLTEHIYGPLGISDTTFSGDPLRLATCYAPADGGGLTPFPVPAGVYVQEPAFESLAAGLVSTVPDQLTFLGSLVGSGPTLLTEQSLVDVRTDRVSAQQRSTAGGFLEPGCGWGYHVETRPDGLIGWAGGLGTIGYAQPSTGRAAFLATQVSFDGRGTAAAFDAFWSLFE